MSYRGRHEAAVAQRLWSWFADVRAADKSELERFAVELGRSLNERISHFPSRMFELPYDRQRVRAWAEGEAIALDSAASVAGDAATPSTLAEGWTKLCEGHEHSPWALIARWDPDADALAEVAAALQPALFHRWNMISCVDRAELVCRLDERQRPALEAFVRRSLAEYWTELLGLEEPLRSSFAHALAKNPSAVTAQRFVEAPSLRQAIHPRVARRSTTVNTDDVERALYDSIETFASVLRGRRRGHWSDDATPVARALWTRAASAFATLSPQRVASIEERFDDSIRCPDLRMIVDDARSADARSNP